MLYMYIYIGQPGDACGEYQEVMQNASEAF